MLRPSPWLPWQRSFSEEGEKFDEQLDIFYLQIPVLAAYRLNLSDNWNMTLKAGPYFAVGLVGNLTTDYEFMGHKEHDKTNIFESQTDGYYTYEGANRFDVGLDLGVDFEYHRFVFGVEYELGFVSITKGDGALRNGAFYATVGWKF